MEREKCLKHLVTHFPDVGKLFYKTFILAFMWLSITLNRCHSVSLHKRTAAIAARDAKHTHTVWTTYTGRCHTHSQGGLDEWA